MRKQRPNDVRNSPGRNQLRSIRDAGGRVLEIAGLGVLKETRARKCVQEAPTPPGERHASVTSLGQPARFAQPVLETARLLLRPLTLDDAPILAQLADRREIADTIISILIPCSEQCARDWIQRHNEEPGASTEAIFAIVLKASKELVGTVGLRDIDREHSQAELGFWIGVNWWRQGFATEAAQALLQFSFENLKLNRVYALYLLRNTASGHVLKRVGMNLEGILRERVRKWGVFEDAASLAIIRKEWLAHVKMR